MNKLSNWLIVPFWLWHTIRKQ